MTVQTLNALSEKEAFGELSKCCGATNWSNSMVAAHPFNDVADLLEKADKYWLEGRESPTTGGRN